MTLTKADIVQQVFIAHPTLTRGQSVEMVEAFLSIAKAAMIAGNDLLLSGFGKFKVTDKKPRRGRNPQTGESMDLGARRVVTFKPSGGLRARVNGEYGAGNHQREKSLCIEAITSQQNSGIHFFFKVTSHQAQPQSHHRLVIQSPSASVVWLYSTSLSRRLEMVL